METNKICPNCRKPLPADVPLGLCPECLIKSGFLTGPAQIATVIERFVPPPVEEIAALFPQLEVLGLIGKGGMGAVYKARQPSLDRFVALKVLPPAVANDPGFAERFNREARALARLSHPNIVAVHDFGKAGSLHYLLMEYVDGANLREIERAGKLLPEQALAIVPQICDALQFAHNEGIVHRDIKPENLLLDTKGRLKMTDFGIAKLIGAPVAEKGALTGAKDVVGTPHYMAPEQIEKPQTVDHRADIFSLGVVFYEMLTGELPIGKFEPPSKRVRVDVRLDEVVLRTLEKEPDRRYQHASEVKTRVEKIASTPPTFGPAVSPAPAAAATVDGASEKTILPAFLLAFFFGVTGAHRFYAGKIWTGILQLGILLGIIPLIVVIVILGMHDGAPPAIVAAALMLGFFVIGAVIWATVDWILLACKAFRDGQGKKMIHWLRPRENIGGPAALASALPPRSSAPPQNPPPPISPGQNVRPSDGRPSGDPSAMIAVPGVALIVAGGLKVLSALKFLIFFSWAGSHWLSDWLSQMGISLPHGWPLLPGTGSVLFTLVPAFVMIFGGIQMIRPGSYGWALAGAIVAIVFCSLIGLVAGIWALVVLSRADAREAFARGAAASTPSPGARSAWPVVLSILAALLVIMVLGGFLLFGTAGAKAFASRNASSEPEFEADPARDAVSESITDSQHRTVELRAETNFVKSMPAAPGGKLILNVDRGEVSVTAADQTNIEIKVEREVTRADNAEANRILREEKLVLKQDGNTFAITGEEPASLRHDSWRSWWGSWNRPNLEAHYDVTVPRKFEAQLKTLGGRVTVTGVRGTVNANTMGGELAFNNIDGNLNGTTMGGGIHADDCRGQMDVHTMGGSIRIKKFAGPGISANTAGGSVSVEFSSAPTADCELHTMGGSVEATIPEKSAITIDAHTMGGAVHSDLAVQAQGKVHPGLLKGTINGGGPRLKLETMGGNIDILKGE